MGEARTTFWTVKKVIGDTQHTMVELVQVDWYKPNPADPENDFLDAEPGDPDADAVDLDGHLMLGATAGPHLSPGQQVKVTVELWEPGSDREEPTP